MKHLLLTTGFFLITLISFSQDKSDSTKPKDKVKDTLDLTSTDVQAVVITDTTQVPLTLSNREVNLILKGLSKLTIEEAGNFFQVVRQLWSEAVYAYRVEEAMRRKQQAQKAKPKK